MQIEYCKFQIFIVADRGRQQAMGFELPAVRRITIGYSFIGKHLPDPVKSETAVIIARHYVHATVE